MRREGGKLMRRVPIKVKVGERRGEGCILQIDRNEERDEEQDTGGGRSRELAKRGLYQPTPSVELSAQGNFSGKVKNLDFFFS